MTAATPTRRDGRERTAQSPSQETPAQPLTRKALRAMAAAAAAGAAATEIVGSSEVVATEPAAAPAPFSEQAAEAQKAAVTLTQVHAEVDEDTLEAELTAETAPVSEEATQAPIAEEQSSEAAATTPDMEPTEAFELAASLYPDAPETSSAQSASAFGAAAEEAAPAAEDQPAYIGTQPRRARSNFRKLTAAAFSVGVMGVVCALGIGMTLPLAPVAAQQAEGATQLSAAASTKDAPIQAFIAGSDVAPSEVNRDADSFQAASAADMASEYGVRNYSTSMFVNDRTKPIQWPFAVGTNYSYGFGMRDGRMHEGIDFIPGEGAEIQAVADGVVRSAAEDGGGYGVNVYIDHVIDGQVVTSHYAHMISGSTRVKVGQKVKVGDIVGLVGNTGRSFGAHLHFEIAVNGTKIDPLPWLAEHAGGFQGGKPTGG